MLTPTTGTGVSIERQQQLLDYIRANPFASIVFSGPPGVGKTTLLYELARCSREAKYKNHAVYCEPMTKFQRDTTAKERGEYANVITPESFLLAKGQQITWAAMFDDFDKVTSSEFIRLKLFAVIDAIVQTGTQLALSTNMNREEFAKFFGDAVAWRIIKHCKWAEVNRETVPANAQPGASAA